MPNNPEVFNHLIDEKSPYLLQHVQNPVDWYPWGKIAFDKAKKEDKPILLSIGYSTCHWCHVMAHESFEDAGIAKLINEHFIAIKVDREERPDIDHVYMTAVTALSGQGGWPLTVFLTSHGDPFFGGTYFPPYAKWGNVGFIDLLNSVAEGWQRDRANVLSSSRTITESLRKLALPSSTTSTPGVEMVMDENLLKYAFRQLRGQFDLENGGFGTSPKFPMGHNLSFLLRYHKRYEEPEALAMVERTLMALSAGGIWDHLAGGFHRYSTDAYWHVPHFEKMLYDQALLSRAYLEAYQVTGSLEYQNTARETLDYVLNRMTDKDGGFYSAEDADSMDTTDFSISGAGGHMKEGAFYVFTQSEIETALGKDAAEIFCYSYGCLPQGNAANDPQGEFVGKNILYQAHGLVQAAKFFSRHEEEIQEILKASQVKLLALRDLRPRPHLDDKVLCDWNGLMLASFAFAGRVLGDEEYTHAALKAADFIMTNMMPHGRLLHRWRQGSAGITATLEDHAFFIYGLLEVYEASFQDKYLDTAKILTDQMIKLYADQAGGFFMTAIDAEDLILRPKEVYDGALPSGNSVAALILLKLYTLTKNEAYLSHAQSLFDSFGSSVSKTPFAHCFLLSALDWHLAGAWEITFQGNQDDGTVAKMLKILYKNFIPSKAVKFTPALNGGQVYLCYQGTCKAPIDNPGVFEQELLGSRHSERSEES